MVIYRLLQVLFTRKTHKFQSINTHHFLVHRAAKIYFETDVLKTAFDKLLEYRCQMCRNTKPLSSFNVLKDHMRREHNLHCCDLCVTHLKVSMNFSIYLTFILHFYQTFKVS